MIEVTIEEMIAAANTVEKLSELYEYKSPSIIEWSAKDIRDEIEHVRSALADEDNYRKVAEPAVKVMLEHVGTGYQDLVEKVIDILRDWEMRPR